MVGCAQLLDDASRCFVTGDGADGDLVAELTGFLVGDLVTSGAERGVSSAPGAGDCALPPETARQRSVGRPAALVCERCWPGH